MINNKEFKQEGGDHSNNHQAMRDIHNHYHYYGLNQSEVREIAYDVFRSNSIKYKQIAAEVVEQRVAEIIELILFRVMSSNPQALEEFKQPSMQDALFTAQKEYAKSGDKDLGDLLVDILVDRANTPQRNTRQILLDESLHLASKLSVEHMDALTVILLAKKYKIQDVTIEKFSNYLESFSLFIDNSAKAQPEFDFLESMRCGKQIVSIQRLTSFRRLEYEWASYYRELCVDCFTEKDFNELVGPLEAFGSFLEQSQNHEKPYRFIPIDSASLKNRLNHEYKSMNSLMKEKAVVFHKSKVTTLENLIIFFETLKPQIHSVFQAWNETPLGRFDISQIGIVIGHANYRRKTGQSFDLTSWIN